MRVREFLHRRLKGGPRQGPESDVVVATSVRMARNIAGSVFPGRATPAALAWVWDKAACAAKKTASFEKAAFFYLPGLKRRERQVLVERRHITQAMSASGGPRGVVLHIDEKISIMINEEDHVGFACTLPGLAVDAAARQVGTAADELSRALEFARAPEWGYMTACPANAGCGLRLSCLLHLPALVWTGKMTRIFAELAKLGIDAHGFYREGIRVLGDMFSVSQVLTAGREQQDILRDFSKIINGIIIYERNAREQLLDSDKRTMTEDSVYRARSVLTGARRMDFTEAATLISRVRLGAGAGLDIPWKAELLDELLTVSQAGHIQELMGKELSPEERSVARARIIRQKLQ